jgi:hypothetical protein
LRRRQQACVDARRLALAAALVQAQPAAGIRLYDGLGKVHFPISTSNPEVQRYFDQGMAFAYGFNHAAAIASFREAQSSIPVAPCAGGANPWPMGRTSMRR